MWIQVSVPLSGLASVNVAAMMGAAVAIGLVSVPLSGLASVNTIDDYQVSTTFNSFRPLIGVSFCKPYMFEEANEETVKVSVPLSGLASVNLSFPQ